MRVLGILLLLLLSLGRAADEVNWKDRPLLDAVGVFLDSPLSNETTVFPADPEFTELWIKSGQENAWYDDWIVRKSVSKIAGHYLAGKTVLGKAFPAVSAMVVDDWMKAGDYDRYDVVAGTIKVLGAASSIILDVFKTINGTSTTLRAETSIWDLVKQRLWGGAKNP
jgi:hypothetical protein